MDSRVRDELLSKNIELRRLFNDRLSNFTMDNIKQIRQLVINFIVISAGIVGFSIPILGRSDLIKNPTLLLLGLTAFFIEMIYGFWYLKTILEKENKQLSEMQDKVNAYITNMNDALNQFFSNPTDINKKNWIKIARNIPLKEKTNKMDYALDILFCCFFLGLVLLLISTLISPGGF